jgi:hypothetical protein
MVAGSTRLKLMPRIAVAIMLCAATVAPASAQDFTDKMKSWLFGPPAVDNNPNAGPNTPKEIDCPGVEVRNGAATLSIAAQGVEAGPMTTRYQVTIGDTARECAPLGGVMTMKVGVQGRILLGPAGGPGKLDVPLRMAVVREGAEPKTIWSKLYRFPVAIPPGQTAVPFVHVEQDVTFPMPRSDELEAYIVYVGFDPSAAPAKPEPRKKKKGK